MEGEQEQVSLEDYLRILFERKWIILGVFLAIVISTAVFTFRQEPIYEATCTIMIEPETRQEDIFQLGYPTAVNIENYTEILKSVTIAEHTIKKVEGTGFSILMSVNPVVALIGRLEVSPVRNTDILKISVKGKTPDEASVLTNTIADVLIELELATSRKEYSEQRHFLEEQMPIVKDRLASVEGQLKRFKERTGLVDLSEETRQLTEKLLDFDKLYGQVESELEYQKSRLASFEVNLEETQRTLIEKISQISSPYILELRSRLVELETTYSMYLVQGLPKGNPKLISLRKSIDETKIKLIEETNKIKDVEIPTLDPLSYSQKLVDEIVTLRINVSAGETRLNVLGDAIKGYEERLKRLPAHELQLIELEREREINANTYKLLMERYEEVRIVEAGKISNVRIIDRARPPGSPVSPKKRLNLILSIIIGLLVGVGGAFVLEYTDNSIKTPKDIERYAGLPIIGSIPMLKRKDNNKPILITDLSSRSTLREALRGIRTNLKFINPDKPIKTLLVTSPIPQEGKTSAAVNLAITLSQLGLKTLIIDADMRKSAVYKFLDIEGKTLTEYLVSGGDIESIIHSTDIDNVSAIISKSPPPNPSELLGSEKIKDLLSDLKEKFDFILIDSPPVLTCTDAAVVASFVDAVLIVVKSHKTPRNALVQTKDIMERVRAKIAGAVLNMVPTGRSSFGYYRYYHYYHYYSYHPYTEEERNA
ncbi:polysaccharide biosynthesis tyrosine autokinase [candidate division WOR-3 bacterium]|nr:polysaccharide biosynthesis tyrosine autokinase [candidate division WOR-3 bacterium]